MPVSQGNKAVIRVIQDSPSPPLTFLSAWMHACLHTCVHAGIQLIHISPTPKKKNHIGIGDIKLFSPTTWSRIKKLSIGPVKIAQQVSGPTAKPEFNP